MLAAVNIRSQHNNGWPDLFAGLTVANLQCLDADEVRAAFSKSSGKRSTLLLETIGRGIAKHPLSQGLTYSDGCTIGMSGRAR